jgi:hypothetical protein
MLLIGCDYHPSWQQICWFDTTTGETRFSTKTSPPADLSISSFNPPSFMLRFTEVYDRMSAT